MYPLQSGCVKVEDFGEAPLLLTIAIEKPYNVSLGCLWHSYGLTFSIADNMHLQSDLACSKIA